ncbi:MAG TPA: ABC-F family ATP-binding cassette domain-containing protein [Candidatus Limnocylindrales bacterium]|nr:ABC-F family ATP-binding cassette domain-containing protein [Candidatus Limnocylindrales bacterium]
MSILRLERVRREVGTFVILDDITAAIAVDDRVGLVGPNGAGKTTLLRLGAGRDEPDEGVVHRKRGLTIGLLAQESHFDEAFMSAPDLRAAVRHGAAHLEAMAARLAEMEHAGQVVAPGYADLQHQFDILGGYTLDLRVDEALSGLGFTRDEWAKPPTALSGGEQTRATLARLVVAQPDLLLLDEPTNHLDIGAIEWLEEHLRRRHGALLVASHDRAFLDATVNRIWELRDRKLTIFRGDYSAYHRQRGERDVRSVKDSDTQADQIEREKELVQRYRSHRKFSKMHEHEARLEKLQAERVESPKATKKLRLPAGALAGSGPSRSGEIVIRVEGLVVGYLPGRGAVNADGAPATEPKRVATVPFLAATRGDRIGIVGPNGAGKTTLLRTIAGDLPPLDGALSFGNAVQPGYLAQLRDAAIPGATVLDALLEAIPVTAGEARGFLARFLFRGDDVFKEVGKLSGGERSRLELALLGIMPSNLLLLDEPTNHLDIPAREAIEAFMHDSPATLLVVSHDRRLLQTVCTSLWVVDDGLAVPFAGGWSEWRAAVADGWTVHAAAEREAARLRGGAHGGRSAVTSSRTDARATSAGGIAVAERPRRSSVAVRSAAGPAVASTPPSRPAARREKLSKDAYRRQRTQVDAELTRLGLRKTQLELSMGSPAIAANFVEMRRVASELADVEAALGAAEDAWLDLEERAP